MNNNVHVLEFLMMIGLMVVTVMTAVKKEIPNPSIDHLICLRKNFGYSQFRTIQWRVIYSILEEKKDNCLIMATGKGKSLCYQYPAVYQTNGLSIVISPLISLMRDQVMALQKLNISASFLGSAQNNTDRSLLEVYAGVCRVLYVTPEWSTSQAGEKILTEVASLRQVTVVAIDEAHCISDWGHDFRSSYRKLWRLRDIFPEVPILALTASATHQVKNDICKSLHMSYPTVTVTSFNRPNLYMSVASKSSSMDDEQIYLNLRPAMQRNGSDFVFPGPTIIYCASKKRTKAVADVLQKYNIKCGVYHAGLTMRQRNEVHEKFLRDELDVVVATVAFGMGIDKPNRVTVEVVYLSFPARLRPEEPIELNWNRPHQLAVLADRRPIDAQETSLLDHPVLFLMLLMADRTHE